MRHRGRSLFQQTITPSLPLQSSFVWARMLNVSVEVSPSHTDPYINTRERKKKNRKQPTTAVAEPSQFRKENMLHLSDRKLVVVPWCITEYADRNATSNGARYLDPFLHDHDTFNQSKCWLVEVQTDTSGSIRPSIKHVSSWPLNRVHWLLSSEWW